MGTFLSPLQVTAWQTPRSLVGMLANVRVRHRVRHRSVNMSTARVRKRVSAGAVRSRVKLHRALEACIYCPSSILAPSHSVG